MQDSEGCQPLPGNLARWQVPLRLPGYEFHTTRTRTRAQCIPSHQVVMKDLATIPVTLSSALSSGIMSLQTSFGLLATAHASGWFWSTFDDSETSLRCRRALRAQ